MQDKSDLIRDRSASDQPYRPPDEPRANNGAVQSNTAEKRSAKPPEKGSANGIARKVIEDDQAAARVAERLLPFTTQIRGFVKGEIHRKALEADLSDSAAGAALLEKAIQGDIDMQYGAMLGPVIETTINKNLRAATDRTANLSLQAFYAAEQARILNIHILRFLLGDAIDELPLIIEESQKQAWKSLKRHGEEVDGGKEQAPWRS